MNRLQGKRALITGGTTGIGLETAREFLKEGARVAITGANPETLDAARKDLGNDVLVISSDAGNLAAQQALAKKIHEAFGGLDILFANAGIVDMRPVEQWNEAAYDRSFAINLKGRFANPAAIVLTASINAHLGMPNSSIYGATKAGLLRSAQIRSRRRPTASWA